MGTLTLYRGDAEKIREFDFSKTDKHCLVGQGIYLTNRLRVAHSYRTKGASVRNGFRPVLFEGVAKDRPDALVKAFQSYLDDYLYATFSYNERQAMAKKPKQMERVKAEQQAQFNRYVEEKKIVAEYGSNYPHRIIKVSFLHENGFGWVSQFEFPEETLKTSVLHVDKPITDTFFWELMWDNKVKVGKEAAVRAVYVALNQNERVLDISRSGGRKEAYSAVRRVIEPYGFKGFEYDGGRIWGGLGHHRAFCLWDDEFVNDHKVKRFK